MRKPKHREENLENVRQPATIVIEQQDEETWWILMNVAYNERPAPWMRRFLYSFKDALGCFLQDPLALVHMPLPSDTDLALAYVGEGSLPAGVWGPATEKLARGGARERKE